MSLQLSKTNPAAKYNVLLKRYPLTTKMVTGAVLGAISELISQYTTPSKDENAQNPTTVIQKLVLLLQKTKFRKLLAMFLYGGLVNAPINHFFYQWITIFTDRRVSSKWKRLSQLCGSWFVVSPIQVFGLITALTLVNMDSQKSQLCQKLAAVKATLRNKYGPMLTSSVISSTAFVSIAQQFISPDKWSVFFSFAYAVLNTGQNIYMKMAPKQGQV
ncbi:LANO_0A04060g1_1 [Lachancea nothofagi CBS 11611]|uniref:LANO_0A04060g1_1 n=1 Tax=Lachancea nothofagi CBS 11611 TaxID=1266666 RepID=A0A1G4IQE9_9SACH|nr:LANO_0A04060g1_1 [Lachancea nothofagi CBS 11611]